MASCMGAYVLDTTQIFWPSPWRSFVGAPYNLNPTKEILLPFDDFFKSALTTWDIGSAVDALKEGSVKYKFGSCTTYFDLLKQNYPIMLSDIPSKRHEQIANMTSKWWNNYPDLHHLYNKDQTRLQQHILDWVEQRTLDDNFWSPINETFLHERNFPMLEEDFKKLKKLTLNQFK